MVQEPDVAVHNLVPVVRLIGHHLHNYVAIGLLGHRHRPHRLLIIGPRGVSAYAIPHDGINLVQQGHAGAGDPDVGIVPFMEIGGAYVHAAGIGHGIVDGDDFLVVPPVQVENIVVPHFHAPAAHLVEKAVRVGNVHEVLLDVADLQAVHGFQLHCLSHQPAFRVAVELEVLHVDIVLRRHHVLHQHVQLLGTVADDFHRISGSRPFLGRLGKQLRQRPIGRTDGLQHRIPNRNPGAEGREGQQSAKQ